MAEPAASARIREEAINWLIKLDGGLSSSEQDDFFSWLAADPRHAEAYACFREKWNDLDVLAQWRPEHSLSPNSDLLAELPRPRRFGLLPLAIGLAAAVAVGFFGWPELGLRLENGSRMLAVGSSARDYQRHILEDGSTIEMNRGAQVAVRYSAERRDVKLLSGEAYFEVAKNPKRPFVVRAGELEVTAVGTAFNVAFDARRVEVLVTEGKVILDQRHLSPASAIALATPPAPHTLAAGERICVTIGHQIPANETISLQKIDRRLAWKAALIEHRRRPLGEVIADFNRYNETQIVLADPSLADIAITASLRPNDIAAFTELLTLTLAISSRQISPTQIELSR